MRYLLREGRTRTLSIDSFAPAFLRSTFLRDASRGECEGRIPIASCDRSRLLTPRQMAFWQSAAGSINKSFPDPLAEVWRGSSRVFGRSADCPSCGHERRGRLVYGAA